MNQLLFGTGAFDYTEINATWFGQPAMIQSRLFSLSTTLLLLTGVTACATMANMEPYNPGRQPDTLMVYPNGNMKLNERPIDSRDVVIYPDGRGGERAAVKMRVPIHPDYYRDSIVVERQPVEPEPNTP